MPRPSSQLFTLEAPVWVWATMPFCDAIKLYIRLIIHHSWMLTVVRCKLTADMEHLVLAHDGGRFGSFQACALAAPFQPRYCLSGTHNLPSQSFDLRKCGKPNEKGSYTMLHIAHTSTADKNGWLWAYWQVLCRFWGCIGRNRTCWLTK